AVAGSDPGADPEGEPSHPEWRDQFLREADGARREVLRKWAGAAEQRLGRWPSSLEEVLAEAPPAERESWERNPARRAALAEGVEVLPATRDVVIGTLAEWQDAQTREFLRLLCRHHELTTGRKPASLRDLDAFPHRPVPPPARHGTRWELDPATGEPEVVNDMADPRLRAPSGPSLLGR
ncbi:MAG: hypothetical protein HUU06_12185, partial [Planctomycetaceae bacterium]|nr:hypothetical protein [Planctomycetaceae bacterium]